jgi:hypothetical protein
VAINFENPLSGVITHYQLRIAGSDAGACLGQLERKPVVSLPPTSCERLLSALPAATASQ